MGKRFTVGLLFSAALFAQSMEPHSGKLDKSGRVEVSVNLSESENVIIQGQIFYREHWRVVHASWKENLIVLDPGPLFAESPYRILILRGQSETKKSED